MDSVYCFAPEGISIVDVDEKKVVKTIEASGHSWADGIVAVDQKLIFINDPRGSQVIVLDLQKDEIIKQIPVGRGAIHIYLTPDGSEVWTHSDLEGAFYVIDVATLSNNVKVEASLTGKGHGKLLLHPELGNKAYATNSIDSALHIVDIVNKKVTGTIGTSGHTHGRVYSPVSKHAYVSSGSDKLAIIDTQTNRLLKEVDGGVQVSISKDGRTVIAANRKEGVLVVVDTLSDQVIGNIVCPGGPDYNLFFNSASGNKYAYSINVEGSNVTVQDLEDMKVVKTIGIGNIIIPEGFQHVHRSGVLSSRSLFIPSSASETLDIIDNETLGLTSVHLGTKVQQALYVGEDRAHS